MGLDTEVRQLLAREGSIGNQNNYDLGTNICLRRTNMIEWTVFYHFLTWVDWFWRVCVFFLKPSGNRAGSWTRMCQLPHHFPPKSCWFHWKMVNVLLPDMIKAHPGQKGTNFFECPASRVFVLKTWPQRTCCKSTATEVNVTLLSRILSEKTFIFFLQWNHFVVILRVFLVDAQKQLSHNLHMHISVYYFYYLKMPPFIE